MSKSMSVTICFRTNEWIRNTLEAVAREDRRSLSQVIVMILEDYVKGQSELTHGEDRRQYSRKRTTIPAFVKGSDSPGRDLHGAVILDISLGGLRISLPKECISEIDDKPGSSRFETSFMLPDGQKPVRMVCKLRRIEPVNGSIYVGASFVDSQPVTYDQLQKYFA